MAVRLADDPPALYRIGRAPNPLSWPPISREGRYNDPQGRLSVLYAAQERRAAFMETLDYLRPSVETLVDGAGLPGSDPIPQAGIVPPRFFARLIVRFAVTPGQRWLDLRAPESHAHLRRALAAEFVEAGYRGRLVLGDLLTHRHDATRIIAKWAIDQGFHGIVYGSCHDPSLTCWAIFDHAVIVPVEAPQAITANDPDLIAVARLWNLRIPDPP